MCRLELGREWGPCLNGGDGGGEDGGSINRLFLFDSYKH